ncbi:MAG: M48 family metallopeptidase [Epsilonproteobacteria bacterium]|nr:M48 family metallopeptidase [Campylobacterota bacterium]
MKISGIGSVKITKKRIKNIYLRIRGGEVILSVPLFLSDEYIKEFIEKRKDWIEKKLDRGFYFLGKRYELEELKGADKLDIDNKKIYINKHTKPQIIEEFYRKKAKEILPLIVKKYSEITGLEFKKITITKAKSRWGSCNYSKKYLNFSLFLISKPLEAIEYVVMHEIAHLKYPNHSKEFYAFIAKYMPDWKKRAKLL